MRQDNHNGVPSGMPGRNPSLADEPEFSTRGIDVPKLYDELLRRDDVIEELRAELGRLSLRLESLLEVAT